MPNPNKHQEAEVRQAEADKRTAHEQLRRLEERGHGNCKEAKRLRKHIETHTFELAP